MKFLLGALCLLFAGTVAHASPYAGNYYLVLYDEYDQQDGGLNLTVRNDGSFTAQGLSLFDGALAAHGSVKDSGTIIFKERYDGTPYKHKGHFKAGGQTFTIATANDDLYGAKISAGFPQAGVYKIEMDEGDEGIFVVYNDGGVYAHLNGTGGGYDVEGKVSGTRFSGATANGQVGFSGTIEGGTITGTYGDNVFLSGDFTCRKF